MSTKYALSQFVVQVKNMPNKNQFTPKYDNYSLHKGDR